MVPVTSHPLRQSAPLKDRKILPAVSTIQELSCVYGSTTTRSRWKVVTQSLNGRDEPSMLTNGIVALGEVVTDNKLAQSAMC